MTVFLFCRKVSLSFLISFDYEGIPSKEMEQLGEKSYKFEKSSKNIQN